MSAELISEADQEAIKNALAVFKDAQIELLRLDYRKLFIAKKVGEALVPLLEIPDLDSNRAITRLLHRAGYQVSTRTVDDYIFVATHWDDIVKAVGDQLEQTGYKKAIRMAREQAKLLTSVPTSDGSTEIKPQVFQKSTIVISPDEGEWGVYADDQFFCRCDKLEVAKQHGEARLRAAHEARPPKAQPADMSHEPAVWPGTALERFADPGMERAQEPPPGWAAKGSGNYVTPPEAQDAGHEHRDDLAADDEPSSLDGITRRDIEEIVGPDEPEPPEPDLPRPAHIFTDCERFRLENGSRLTCLDGNGHAITLVARGATLPGELRNALALWEGR
jgi:hypothetical protein